MSPEFQATLMRARDYAFNQGHAHVVVEHLLLSLTEDGDATVVMQSCNLDLNRLRNDVAGFLGANNDIQRAAPGTQPVIAQQLTQILSYATIAARQGRRDRVDGAIVLAALIGEGRSMGAGFLKAQGLTFEAAVQVLQRGLAAAQAARSEPAASPIAHAPPATSMVPARHSPPASGTDDILNRARERVEARTGGRLRGTEPPPETAPPRSGTGEAVPVRQEPALPEPPAFGAPQAVAADGAMHGDGEPPARREPSFEAAAPVAGAHEPPRQASPAPSVEAPAAPMPQQALQQAPQQPAQQLPPSTAVEEVRHADAERLNEALARARAEPPVVRPDMRGHEQAPAPVLPMPSHLPPQQAPYQQAPPPQRAQPPVRPDAHAQGPGWSPPPLPVPGSGRQVAPPSQRVPRHPGPEGEPYFEPVPGRGGTVPPGGSPHMRAEPAAPAQPPMPQHRRGPPPGMPAGVGVPGHPSGGPPPAMREPPRRGPPLDTARMTQSFPDHMRIDRASIVEVRVGRTPVSGLTRAPSSEASRQDLLAARAVTARLRSATHDVTIEASSPETQWDFPSPSTGLLTADEAVWRFSVTPRKAGEVELTLAISARTLGADGVIADMTLPETPVAIAVRRDHVRAARRLGTAVLLFAGGIVLTKSVEVLFGIDLARAVRRVAGL